MTVEKPSNLVPKLRFREFQSAGEWEPKKLGDIAKFFKGKGLPKSMLSTDGTRQCIHYGELFTAYPEVIKTVFSKTDLDESLFLSADDDVLMPTSDVTPNGLAKACCLKLRDVVIGGDILVIRTDQHRVGGEFLARYIRHLEPRVLQLVTGSTVYHLYANSLKELDLQIPSLSEQRKITDCLGSLDDLIEAKVQKLEALRQHKQGLIQQLLPKPGETQPSLRFIKSCEPAEWQQVPLSRLLTFQNGYPFSSGAFDEEKKGLRLIRNRDLRFDDRIVYYDGHPLQEFVVKDGDLLVGMDGDFTPCVWHKGIGLLNQRVGRILPRGNHVLRFLGYLLEIHLKVVQEDTARTTVKRLSSRTVEGMIVHVPDPDEQQHIADFLSSLDNLIMAEDRKLEALRQHKKGLMQRLFPSLEEESR